MNRALLLNLLIVILCLSFPTTAQRNTGVPLIVNFSPNTYRQGPQNFSVIQDSTGVLYFGNNNGVLIYDGIEWEIIPVTNKSEVHSLGTDSKGTIYVGAQGEFGYLQRDTKGKLNYVSLVHLLSESDREFNDVWAIYRQGSRIVLRSTAGIYILENNSIKTIKLANNTHRSFFANNEIFVRQDVFGLQQLIGDSLVTVSGGELFNQEPIHTVFPYKSNQYLVITENLGLYTYDGKTFRSFKTEADELIKGQSIFGSMLPDSTYALGTRRNGLIIIDNRGRLINSISKKQGLQDESIWAVCRDQFSGSLWLAHNNGISCVETSSPFSIFNDKSGIQGQLYNVAKQFNRIYAAGSLGVFYKQWVGKEPTDFQNNIFHPLENLQMQAWHFYQDSTSLLVATNRGIFEISEDNTVTNIGFTARTWFLLPLRSHPGYILVNTGEGLIILKKEKKHFKIYRNAGRIPESLYSFSQDENGNIWVDSPAKGIFKFTFPKGLDGVPEYKLYNSKNGLPSDYKIHGFNTKTFGTIFGTEKGIYKYDNKTDRFTQDQELNTKLFGSSDGKEIDYIKEDATGFIWIITINKNEQNILLATPNKTGSFILANSVFTKIKNYKVRDFLTVDAENILMGTSDGIVHFNSKKIPQNNLAPLLRKIVFTNTDSVFRHSFENVQYSFPFQKNSLRFYATGTGFTDAGSLQFQYFLKGFDVDWSAWNSNSVKEYTNLPERNYTLSVRVRDQFDHVAEGPLLSFTVNPPWFRTSLAYIGYTLLAIGSIALVSYWRSRNFILVNKRLEQLVTERTEELKTQKEEISDQKGYIEKKNEELEKAREVIGQQYEKLKDVNQNLEVKVSERTAELEEAYEDLLSLKSELDTFVYRASHDINGPVVRLLGLCNVALMDVKDEKAREYIQTLESEAKLTTRMLRKLLTFYELKNKEPELKAVNLYEIVERISKDLKKSLNASGSTIKNTIPEGFILVTDVSLLSAVLANVIENAIQFSKPLEHPHQVNISAKKADAGMEITITDNGIGVDSEIREKIFDKFFRGTERSRGAGLGLFIAQEALKKLDGTIRHSEDDLTHFIISLPVR